MCRVPCEILGVKDQEGKVPAQTELTDGPLEESSRKPNAPMLHSEAQRTKLPLHLTETRDQKSCHNLCAFMYTMAKLAYRI